MQAPTDEKLLEGYLAGDPASFELLVRRHAQELYQFILRFTGDSVAAEDVVQETLVQVHHSAASFDPTRRFKPWLFTIAANKARDFLRRRKRRHELPFDAHMAREEESGQRFIDLLAGEGDAPDRDLVLEEKRQVVRQAVEAMPAKLRDVLILAYYHRFPYRDISELVGVPLGTVKSRLHAAIACFRTCYVASANEHSRDEP